MKTLLRVGIFFGLTLSALVAPAVSVAPEEMSEARRWAAAKFEGVQQAAVR